MRMMTLYFQAEFDNLMVLGTTNRTEYKLGWFTKYGDSAVDLEILINLPKTRVFELAKILKLPQFIINKEPSADIIPGIGDKNLGISYRVLDCIIYGLENNIKVEKLAKELTVPTETVNKVQKLMSNSEMKRIVPLFFEGIK